MADATWRAVARSRRGRDLAAEPDHHRGVPDRAQAWAWYRSPEYAAALHFRDAALSRNLILVDGVAA